MTAVTSEPERVPCRRTLLASVSKPLRKAFYGDFQESKDREVLLQEGTRQECTVTRHAFALSIHDDYEAIDERRSDRKTERKKERKTKY